MFVTDIRMPPAFQREGIDAAKELRKRHPGTGIVVLSQYDDPEYAISLLADGAAGYAYLLKDRIAEGNQLARAVREVATGGSVLDPKIVEALVHPVAGIGGLTADEENLLQQVAQGRPIKAIAASQHTTPAVGRGARRQVVPRALTRREHRRGRRAQALAEPAPGDRRPRGARRDAEPPAARPAWPRRSGSKAATSARPKSSK